MKTLKITNSKNTLKRTWVILVDVYGKLATPANSDRHAKSAEFGFREIARVRVVHEDMYPGSHDEWRRSIEERLLSAYVE